MCAVTIAAGLAMLTAACRQRERPDGNTEGASEPERYTALMVRIVDDGKRSETVITRETRAGECRREEWTEDGQNRALIWRPDIGKAFLLDLDRRVYLEIDIGAAPLDQWVAGSGSPHDAASQPPSDREAQESAVQAIDNYFGDTQSPTSVVTLELPPTSVDGHPCAVYEDRKVFPDGHTEITRRFRARDLFGLALRVESSAEPGGATVITERREVRLEVAPDAFNVPEGFRRVEKLTR